MYEPNKYYNLFYRRIVIWNELYILYCVYHANESVWQVYSLFLSIYLIWVCGNFWNHWTLLYCYYCWCCCGCGSSSNHRDVSVCVCVVSFQVLVWSVSVNFEAYTSWLLPYMYTQMYHLHATCSSLWLFYLHSSVVQNCILEITIECNSKNCIACNNNAVVC